MIFRTHLNQSISTEIDLVASEPFVKKYRYSICTMVTDYEQYDMMLASFIQKGFTLEFCEFFHIDNTRTNKEFPFAGYNRFLNYSSAEYVIFCHQDVRLEADDFHVLNRVLEQLCVLDPNWAVVGNAGGKASGDVAINIIHPQRTDRSKDVFPVKVFSLDENFIIIRNSKRIGFSGDLDLFHFYGTDICLHAELMGWSCYVVDFLLKHLSIGNKDTKFIEARNIFEKRWDQALRARKIRTTCTTTFIDGAYAFHKDLETSIFTKQKQVFQIYDRNNQSISVSPRLLPLDIADTPRPDWREFYPISEIVRKLPLDDDSFFGFLANNFNVEMELHPQDLLYIVDGVSSEIDVVLVSKFELYNPLVRNNFILMDSMHEGVIIGLRSFFEASGTAIDFDRIITTVSNSCLSTHLIAKPSFWSKWLSLANLFFEFVEASPEKMDFFNHEIQLENERIPLKVLLMRMLATVVLVTSGFKTYTPESIRTFAQFEPTNQKVLFELEALKQYYCLSGDRKFLLQYEEALTQIWPNTNGAEKVIPVKRLYSS